MRTKKSLFSKAVIVMLLIVCFTSFFQNLSAQNPTGKVVDEKNEELAGATVTIKGSSTGTITDVNGNFSIPVTTGQVLIFSYLGFQNREILFTKQNDIVKVVLRESVSDLDEVVVIAYGTTKRRDLSGSVVSLKGEELNRANPTSLNEALQGRVAGVMVSQSDGAPGAGINIQIRGANSFTTSVEPLYIVDGIPFNMGEAPGTDYGMKQANNPLSSINPKDIESIEILKDASATAIYGSRGANGVILISTRKGATGRSRVDFSTNISVSNVVKKIAVLDAATFAEYRNEQSINLYTYDGRAYIQPRDLPFPIPGYMSYTRDPITQLVTDSVYHPSPQDWRDGYWGGGTNWQDQIYHTALTKDYNLTVSGGDTKGQYLFSAGMLDQQGVIVNSYFKRYSFRSNVNRQIRNWFHIDNAINLTKSENRLARTNTENWGVINDAISFQPTRQIFDPDEPSGLTEDTSNGLSNPYGYVRNAKNLVGVLTLGETLNATVKFTDYLNFKQRVGYWYSQNERHVYYNRYTSGGVRPTNGSAQVSDNFYSSFTTESMLSFNKSFSDNKHRVDAVAVWGYEKVEWGDKGMSGTTFANDIMQEYAMAGAENHTKPYVNRGESALMSFSGRVNYVAFDKLVLTGTFRRDGSSRLNPDKPWRNFTSFATAWNAGDEQFIKDLNIFSNLKIRYSYGNTGNQGIGAYATRSRFTPQPYVTDGSITSGFAEDRWGGPAAPLLGWENTTQNNLGFELGFLHNRINFVVEMYQKKTKDLLHEMFIPPSSGFSVMRLNSDAIVHNKGLELAGSFFPVDTRDFSWKIDANISFNRNKITNLEADEFFDVVWGLESMFIARNDHPIGTIYGFVEDGYYNNEAEVRADPQYMNESDAKIRSMIGQIKYKDLNGDGVIDNRDKDVIGNTNPNFTYGLTNTFTYKNFSLNFFLQGTKGNDILNTNLRSHNLSGTANIPQFVYDNRWTAENKHNAQFPRPDITYTRSLRASDRYVEDGSYLRMKNLNLSYRIMNPHREIDALTLSVGVTNLFTITKYRWYDPDVNSWGGDAKRRGIDMNAYPSARTINFGLNLTF